MRPSHSRRLMHSRVRRHDEEVLEASSSMVMPRCFLMAERRSASSFMRDSSIRPENAFLTADSGS